MIPPFNDHPLIRQYNEIKKYFRKYETEESRTRINELKEYTRLIDLMSNRGVAFDITGSLNFGMTLDRSDVDVVLYMECHEHGCEECTRQNCARYRRIEDMILKSLVQIYASHKHEIQIIDCINLHYLGQELDRAEADSNVILRFAFYRSICRAINAHLLRPYHVKLQENKELVENMKPNLFMIFDGLITNSRHQLSLQKYQQRLRDLNVDIPETIQNSIRHHLNQYSDGFP